MARGEGHIYTCMWRSTCMWHLHCSGEGALHACGRRRRAACSVEMTRCSRCGVQVPGKCLLCQRMGDLEELARVVRCSEDFVFTLRLSQLLSHIDLEVVFARLPNLTALYLSYGVRNIGIKCVWGRVCTGCMFCGPHLAFLVFSDCLLCEARPQLIMCCASKRVCLRAHQVSCVLDCPWGVGVCVCGGGGDGASGTSAPCSA
jgi:hypothetical protein